MLNDEQIAEALALIDDRYQKIITQYLQKVGKTILKIGKLNQSSINLLIQLRRMGVDVKTIERELQKVTSLTKRDIKALYERAAQEANTDARFEYVHKGVEPNSIRWTDLVESIWSQTAGAMDNLAGTTAIDQNYREIVDEAVQAVSMGVTDYNSAIRNAVKKAGRAGLQVEYASGVKRRLDSAVRQNILDGVRQVQQKAQDLIGEEIGADGVDITAHPNSAPDHEPVQGRRFDLENFQLMQSARPFEDVDGNHYDGFERPITQWRCRHLVYYILIGISRRMYSDEQLKQWEEQNQKGCIIDGKHYTNYEATQLMRNLELEIRRQKDTAVLAKASGDDVLRRDCQSKINKLTQKYKAVAEASRLRTRFKKTRVDGFKPTSDEIIERIGRSVGAKAKNYQVYDPQSGNFVQLAEGTILTQPKNHVMAGKGRERKIDCIDWLLDKYGGDELQWTKEKGFGYVEDEYGEIHRVELHWYQEPSVGRVEMKLKYRDGRVYLDDD